MNIIDEKPIHLPQFEDRLWAELEQLDHEPVVAPAGVRAPWARRRGRYLAAVGGLAAAACIAAVALAVVDRGSGQDPDSVGGPGDVRVQPGDDAADADAQRLQDALEAVQAEVEAQTAGDGDDQRKLAEVAAALQAEVEKQRQTDGDDQRKLAEVAAALQAEVEKQQQASAGADQRKLAEVAAALQAEVEKQARAADAAQS